MTNINKLINKSLLFSGKDLKISDTISIRHPCVGDILDINNGIYSTQIYWTMVSLLMCDPYNNMVVLDDLGYNYQEVEPFDVFMIQWNQFLKDYTDNKEAYEQFGLEPLSKIKQALQFFLGEHDFQLRTLETSDGVTEPVLCDVNMIHDGICDYIIDKKTFGYLSEFVTQINCIDKSQRINPIDNNARIMLIEDMRDELKRKQREQDDSDDNTDYIGSIMSAVCFGGNGNISVFNVNDVKIFQLINGYNIINKKDRCNHLLNGLYFGTVSAKDINKKELSWMD